MPTDLEFRVSIRDPRALAFVFRRGGAKVHLVTLRGGVRLVRAKCGRALHDDHETEHTIVLLAEAWWPSSELCARCLRQAQKQQLVVVTPYRETDRRSDTRRASMTLSRALSAHNGEDRQS